MGSQGDFRARGLVQTVLCASQGLGGPRVGKAELARPGPGPRGAWHSWWGCWHPGRQPALPLPPLLLRWKLELLTPHPENSANFRRPQGLLCQWRSAGTVSHSLATAAGDRPQELPGREGDGLPRPALPREWSGPCPAHAASLGPAGRWGVGKAGSPSAGQACVHGCPCVPAGVSC